jgi:hypothetical protein
MLTIENIHKLEGCKVAGKGVVWKIMQVNENDYKSDKIYTIVVRTYPDLNYGIHLYLERELKDGDYHIHSSLRKGIKKVVERQDMVDVYNFLRLIKKEIERGLC